MDTAGIQEKVLKTTNRFHKIQLERLFPAISKREFEMLKAVERCTDGNAGKKGICVSELAGRLKVSSPAVSRMVSMLEEKGYIGRNIDREDRRNTYIYLTEEGKEVTAAAQAAMCSLMERVAQRMGEEDMQQLIMLWNRLADIMEEELRADNV